LRRAASNLSGGPKREKPPKHLPLFGGDPNKSAAAAKSAKNGALSRLCRVIFKAKLQDNL
jgi:hypothetical protein